MRLPARLLWAFPLIACALASPVAEAQTIATLGNGFSYPQGVAVGNGNIFVADTGNAAVKELIPSGNSAVSLSTLASTFGFASPQGIAVDGNGDVFVGDAASNAVYEIVAAGGYVTVNALGSGFGFNHPYGVAVDGSGNVFVADSFNNAVEEIVAAGGYTTVNTIGSGFNYPTGVAVDRDGNVFVADAGNNAVKEILAAGGYTTVKTLGSGFNTPDGIAIDGNDDVFVADTYNNAVKEIVAMSGYTTVNTIADGFFLPTSVAVDGKGNVFVADTFNNAIKEILAAPPSSLTAAVLPGSRSVAVGTPATVFATMINSGTSSLGGCAISLPPTPPFGLALTYQTTNPTTNALTGTANTPVAIAANGSQSFVVSLQGTAAVTAPGFALGFACDQANVQVSAPVFPGVDTLDLFVSATPVPDVIALAATATNDGTAHLANNSGSFAVATDNIGASGAITAATDYNGAMLPLTATICQSSPTTGACLIAPTTTVVIANFATGTTPTFAIFLNATSSIQFNPAGSRVFLRFIDANGDERGATSVAVTTN